MQRINTHGISCLEPLEGNPAWYWGTDCAGGDLYEAEELFRDGHPVRQNRLVLVRASDGKVLSPAAKEGQYWGRPLFCEGQIALLRADFPAETVEILRLDPGSETLEALASLPLSQVEDCYNLMLKGSPLTLTRQGQDGQLRLLWPERRRFALDPREVPLCRRGNILYCSVWYEDPAYREEAVLRRADTGEILERRPGSLMLLPDGRLWHLL